MDINDLKLEPFADHGGRFSRNITINRSYGFGIPPAFFRENGLNENAQAVLFFDPTKKIIGIKFVTEDPQGFKLNVYGEGIKKGASFIARSFFKKFNLDPEKYHGRYEPMSVNLPNVGKVFLIELKEDSEKE